MKKERIGIFGGTFNPPHIGHIEAAKAFVNAMNLDRLIIMPAYIPPHKEYLSTVSCHDRLNMCKIAFGNVDKATVSDLEIARGGKSYTYLTLEELSSSDNELYFLCGTDMIISMDRWKNPDIIFSLANICYIRREKNDDLNDLIKTKCDEYRTRFGASVFCIDSDVVEISSSEIRNDPSLVSSYLTDEVLKYINDRGIYQ